MRKSVKRWTQAGTTLAELTVAMGVASILSVGFLTTVNSQSNVFSFENRLTFYAAEAREIIHQIARDLRATGSNPLSKPYLFDGDPSSDEALLLDPNLDGDITNDIEVHYDRFGGAERNDPDGDADDDREAIRYLYKANEHRIYRETRIGDGWASEIILLNVCDFAFSFYDSKKAATTDPEKIVWIGITATTTTAPSDCYDVHEITREWKLNVKLRNR